MSSVGFDVAWIRIMDDAAPTLQTQRLVLQPLRAEDADALMPVLDDERMYAFTGGQPPTLDQLRDRCRRLAVGRSPDGSQSWFNWVVRRHGANAPVGTVQATVVRDDPIADVAWEIGLEWQGHGFASEAATVMVDWLISEGIRTIDAYIHVEHVASARVAERVGLVQTDELVDGEFRWRRIAAHPNTSTS